MRTRASIRARKALYNAFGYLPALTFPIALILYAPFADRDDSAGRVLNMVFGALAFSGFFLMDRWQGYLVRTGMADRFMKWLGLEERHFYQIWVP